MSSTYLVLKNNNEHNASISVDASSAYVIKEIDVNELVYLAILVAIANLFFKGLERVLDLLMQRRHKHKDLS